MSNIYMSCKCNDSAKCVQLKVDNRRVPIGNRQNDFGFPHAIVSNLWNVSHYYNNHLKGTFGITV